MSEMNHTGLIADYIQGRMAARLEKLDKDAEKSRRECVADMAAIADLEIKISEARASEVARYAPKIWISDAAIRAKQISFVSHPIKFTHTDAKGSSCYVANLGWGGDDKYLTSTTLFSPSVDVVGNAAALDVASFLQLTVGGKNLAHCISIGDMSSFVPFMQDEVQLEEWKFGFTQALVDKKLKSHSLAKQLYFPISDECYHLISPLYSSSLAQALYLRIAESRYSEPAKELRKLKRENKFSPLTTVDYLNVAVQTFGGTKPQNVSQLNSGRNGKSYLLSCQPPAWKTSIAPPSGNKKAFWREFDRRAWRTAKALKAFLVNVAESDGTKSIRDKRAEWVDELIEILFQYAAEIQNMTEHSGWSTESNLSRAEQLWLDPFRQDDQFQIERQAKEWQRKIAEQFSGWLNHKLADDKLVMKDSEYFEWRNLLNRKLSRLEDDLSFEFGMERASA